MSSHDESEKVAQIGEGIRVLNSADTLRLAISLIESPKPKARVDWDIIHAVIFQALAKVANEKYRELRRKG